MKAVLLISQDYPPQGWTSSRRSGSMAKYLGEFDWHPIVVCQHWTPENCVFDPTIVTGIPSDVLVLDVDIAPPNRRTFAHLMEYAARGLLPHIVPTDFVTGAKRRIAMLVEQTKVDAIWATAPMACNHTIAAWASSRWGIPWIADFRDVLQFNPPGLSRLVRPLRIIHEKRVIGSASFITTVSEGFGDTLAHRHGRPIHIIPNGFDPEILGLKKPESIPKFNIVYTGGVNLGAPNFRPLLDAVESLVGEGEIEKESISIDFFGADNHEALERMFIDHPYADLVHDHGHVPRAKVLKVQQAAAVLLQATYPGTGTLTSKIYEYLAARRPILAIPCDDNGIDQLLRETNAGVSCSGRTDIATRLLNWYREWKATGTTQSGSDISSIMRYSRREQARQLALLLNQSTLP